MTEDWHKPPRLDQPVGVTEHGDVVFPLRTEAVVAQELRDELGPLLDQVCEVMAKAKASGLQLAWNIQPDSFRSAFPRRRDQYRKAALRFR